MSVIKPHQSSVFHRELDREYPLIVRGDGYRVYDDEGREYLDAVGGGAGVVNVGYGVQEVVEAAKMQVEVLPFIHNQKFSNPPQEELAGLLLRHAPKFARVIFCQGGAEANETAIRLARSYHVERGDQARWRIISVAQAYHGSTVGTIALTDRPKTLQFPYGPYLPDFLHIKPVDLDEDKTGEGRLADLDKLILDAGPETIAGFLCEPISAAAAPAFRPPDTFFSGLSELAKRYGFLVIFDEVVTGIGRTGTFFAADQLPIDPDIITTAKGLGGGYVPMGAVLSTERVYEAVAAGSRDFSHGHTFNGYPLGCAVGIAILQHLDRYRLIERVARLGPVALGVLREALADAPFVHEVRGQGFLFGITYRDPSRAFLDPSLKVARRVDTAALAEALLTYSTQPTADGMAGDQTMLTPAFTTTDEDFEEIARRLARAIKKVARDVEQGRPLELVLG
jgi:adenosylmethionine-8-amino-7-oxononanoate aminotransferase